MTRTVKCLAKANFIQRAAAFAVDLAVIWMGTATAVSVLAWIPAFNEPIFFKLTALTILLGLMAAAYRVVMTALFGATLGKLAFRLQVVDQNGEKPKFIAVLYRETVGRYLSTFFMVGYLMALFSKSRLALHDRITDTRVVVCVKGKIPEEPKSKAPAEKTPADPGTRDNEALPLPEPVFPDDDETLPEPVFPETEETAAGNAAGSDEGEASEQEAFEPCEPAEIAPEAELREDTDEAPEPGEPIEDETRAPCDAANE